MRTRTICSVFWKALDADRPYRKQEGGPNENHFHIDACAPGEFKTLPVYDMYQWTYAGNDRWGDTPVYADGEGGIAQCLARQWGQNVIYGSGNSGPGVFVCEGDEPTEAELATARARQRNWAERLCLEAEQDWVRGNKTAVGEVHKEAARWLGRMDYDWVKDIEPVALGKCPFCRSSIDSLASVCPVCTKMIDFARFNETQAKLEALQGKIAENAKVTGTESIRPLPPPMNPNTPKRAVA